MYTLIISESLLRRNWEKIFWEAVRMSSTKADNRALAVCIAAFAAMLLCFAAGRAAMTAREALPWEPPNRE